MMDENSPNSNPPTAAPSAPNTEIQASEPGGTSGVPPLPDSTPVDSSTSNAAPAPPNLEGAGSARNAGVSLPSAEKPRNEVIVNFAEPAWHKERLQRVEEENQRLIAARKKTRSGTLALVLFALFTVLAYWRQWSSTLNAGLLGFDALLALALVGNYLSERDTADAFKNAESLAKLSLTLFPKKEGAEHNYFESLVSINVENLREYYLLVKKHTSYSYRVSLAAGVFGFLLISGALVASYWRKELTSIAYIGTGAGLVVEFIAGIFFYLYNKTVRQLKGVQIGPRHAASARVGSGDGERLWSRGRTPCVRAVSRIAA